MKKLARLTALLLTGALLLMLTACGAAPGGSASMTPEEIAAKQRLLGEITSYRESIQLAPLDEVEQLSAAEQVWAEQFRASGKTELPYRQTDEAYEKWESMIADWTCCDNFGWGWDGKGVVILSAKVPANTPEGKAELLDALKVSPAFNNSACTRIGIAVVTIDGQMYWTCSVYS